MGLVGVGEMDETSGILGTVGTLGTRGVALVGVESEGWLVVV